VAFVADTERDIAALQGRVRIRVEAMLEGRADQDAAALQRGLGRIGDQVGQRGPSMCPPRPVSAPRSACCYPQLRTPPMTDEPIRVLMVEDQNDLREMIGLALRDFGIEVSTTVIAQACQAAAVERLTLRVYRDNAAAVAVYSSLGFEPVDAASTPALLFMQRARR